MATTPSTKIQGLTDNVWVVSADNKLQVTDAYSIKADNIINSIANFKDKLRLDENLLGQLIGGIAMAKSMKDTFDAAKDIKDKLSSGSIKDRLTTALPLLGPVLKKSGIPFADEFEKNISTYGQMAVKAGDQIKNIQEGNYNAALDIANVAAAYTGKKDVFELIDPNGQMSLCTTVMKECLKTGVPNSWEALAGNLVDSSLGPQLGAMMLPEVVKYTGTDMLESIAKVSGIRNVLAIYPNVLEDYSKNFFTSLGRDLDERNKPKEYQDIMNAYSKVDDTWWLTPRANTPVFNLLPIGSGSDAFKDVVNTGLQESSKADEKYYVLGLMFEPTTVKERLEQDFPMTHYALQSQSTNPVVDPTVLAYR